MMMIDGKQNLEQKCQLLRFNLTRQYVLCCLYVAGIMTGRLVTYQARFGSNVVILYV